MLDAVSAQKQEEIGRRRKEFPCCGKILWKIHFITQPVARNFYLCFPLFLLLTLPQSLALISILIPMVYREDLYRQDKATFVMHPLKLFTKPSTFYFLTDMKNWVKKIYILQLNKVLPVILIWFFDLIHFTQSM